MRKYRTIYTDHQSGDRVETEENKAEKIRLRKKLMTVLGCILIIGIVTPGSLAVKAAKRMIHEQAETVLIEQAKAAADMLDKETEAFFQYVEAIAHTPVLKDPAISNSKKAKIAYEQAAFNNAIRGIVFCNTDGQGFMNSGEKVDVSNEKWFRAAVSGEHFVSEPAVFSFIDKASLIFAVPIYMGDKITGVLSMIVSSDFFSKKIESITVGYTGYCFIVGLTGTTIAHRDNRLVEGRYNIIPEAATDGSLASFKAVMETALSGQTGAGYYTFMDLSRIAAYTPMQTTGWILILTAPEIEFTGAAKKFTTMIIITGTLLLVVTLIVARVVIRKII